MDSIDSLQIIGSKSFGGAERWLQRFSLALNAHGHKTHLGVRKGYDLDGDHWGGLPYHPLSMRSVWDPFSRFEIQKRVRQLRPAIVQTYMGRATRLTRLKAGRLPVHVARIGGYYKLNGYRHAHAWVGNTKGVCDYLIRHGFPKDRVFKIPNFFAPVAAGESSKRATWGIPEDAWVLMTPGRLVPVKGQRYLIEALARMPSEIGGRPVWLIVLGDGPLRAQLHKFAYEHGVAGRTVWAGWQTEPGPFFRMADLVVFPSLDEETFGNVILEAWAYQRPLVATAFRGARKIVQAGDDALIAPCGNGDALAQMIKTALRDEGLRDSLIEAGHDRLIRDFSKSAIIAEYVALYTELIKKTKID